MVEFIKQVIRKRTKYMIFKTIRHFGRELYNDSLSLDNAFEQQIRLKDDIDLFKESTKPKEPVKKKKKM